MNRRTVAVIVAIFYACLWLFVATFYKTRALDLWEADYAAASLHAMTPAPGSRAAEDFALAYDKLKTSNVITAPVYYVQAQEAHKAWAIHWR